MKILCISVHPVLEYDEIKLFESMGHSIFSLGFYFDRAISDSLRPSLPSNEWHHQCSQLFFRSNCKRAEGVEGWHITQEFANEFDIIIVHHNRKFVAYNWDVIYSKIVVWRTIGQELQWAEEDMAPYRKMGLKIVRWSPAEQEIPGYIGHDAIIHAAKSRADWHGWAGAKPRILTFNNDFAVRSKSLNLEFYLRASYNMPCDLYGLRNEGLQNWLGFVNADTQVDLLREYRAAFITGTWPAPYTLGFIEAWMTGIPVIHLGRTAFAEDTLGSYEIDSLISHGTNGWLVDSPEEARDIFNMVINDREMCIEVSKNGREAAIRHFGVEQARNSWREFFSTHCLRDL